MILKRTPAFLRREREPGNYFSMGGRDQTGKCIGVGKEKFQADSRMLPPSLATIFLLIMYLLTCVHLCVRV